MLGFFEFLRASRNVGDCEAESGLVRGSDLGLNSFDYLPDRLRFVSF